MQAITFDALWITSARRARYLARFVAMISAPQLPGYDVLHRLGIGGSGQVWAVRRADGLRLAAKFVDQDEDDDILQHEASLLQALRHEHVIRLHEVVPVQNGGRALVMQLAEGGSLAESLATREHLTPGELVTVLCPIARALHDLHSQGLMHGDLSPGNILFTQEGKPLIADLGFSQLAGQDDMPLWATERWAAPEVLAGRPLTPAGDAYSLGAIAWTALVGTAPEPAALRPHLADVAPTLTHEMRDLVMSCLSHTPSARPTPEEFALSLWQLAPALPAPVQGSTGRRGVVDAEPADLGTQLTRRIREEARREGAARPGVDAPRGRHSAATLGTPAWWRTRAVAVASAAATFVGLVAGGLMLVGGSPADRVPVRAVVDQIRTASGVAPVVKKSDRGQGAPTSRPTSPAPPSTATGPKPLSSSSLASSPVKELQGVVRARADAWMSGEAADLRSALVMGSPAGRSDASDLARARAAGMRYSQLAFTVRSARMTSSTGSTAQLTAVIDRSGYTVSGPAGARTVAPERGVRSQISLSRTPDGWRISEWATA